MVGFGAENRSMSITLLVSTARFVTKLIVRCATAAVLMLRLLSTDGRGVASILGDVDRRWPWLKCQVDRPSGAGAITAAAQQLFSRGPPRKRQENGVEVPTDGEGPYI